MKVINTKLYKENVIRILKEVGKPIWVSDLKLKYGLPCVSLNSKRKRSPTQKALRELERNGKVVFLVPRYAVENTTRPRRKISLPINKQVKRTYEIRLLNKIVELEKEVAILKAQLKTNNN